MFNILITLVIFDLASTIKQRKGFIVLTMYYTDSKGSCVPVSFRVCDKSVNKIKNDYLLEMFDELITLGLQPSAVTADSWVCFSEYTLKTVKNHCLGSYLPLNPSLVSQWKGT